MRFLAAAVLAFSILNASAQEVKLSTDKVDDFTGEVTRVTEYMMLGDNGEKGYAKYSLKMAAIKVGDVEALWLLPTTDLGCCGASGNYAMFKFSDGEVLKKDDIAKIDCGDFTSSTILIDDELKARIDANDAPTMIRLKQSEYYGDFKTIDAEMWKAVVAAINPVEE